MTDGWICTGNWCDCEQWPCITWGLCGLSICFCIFPIVPLCTKCGTRSNEARNLTEIDTEQPKYNPELDPNLF